ncbi:MAG: class I SAM-dependent methyltransferase [Actinomycetota bacterium]|nr:class I SAM-dependent methyltransferase [Actinomycetota bacterium]
MERQEDAIGQAMLDHLEGRGGEEIVERDDGFILATGGPADYFAPCDAWPAVEQQAMELVKGRVLDVGCGAGRGALELQERGHEVVAIDVSPGAVEVCTRRGVNDARVLTIEDIGPELGTFDTILLLGVNFGLLGDQARATELLARFAAITTERGRMVAGSRDPYTTVDPIDLDYQQRNRDRGRLPGQRRLRVRYRNLATPWFDWLTVSVKEMEEIAARAGWRVTTILDSNHPLYVAVLEKGSTNL